MLPMLEELTASGQCTDGLQTPGLPNRVHFPEDPASLSKCITAAPEALAVCERLWLEL